MFIRSHYNYDVKAASDESGYNETMPSLTVQSMSDDADLNIMLKRFNVTGKMPENVRLPQYGDFSHITDFQSALNAVRDAEDEFMTLPAEVRAKFENNPQLMLDFVENPANIESVKQIFGEKNVVREEQVVRSSAGGEASPPGGVASPASGVGASAGDGRVGVSK